VEYCAFGYDPDLFPTDSADGETDDNVPEWDVFFAGGADAERAEAIGALQNAGLRVALYGSYWERYPETRRLTRGQLPAAEIRLAARKCKVALCLVRRANRDEHCMRTFEMPAIGMAMVAEDTGDHRAIFGAEGECVLYFRSHGEMVQKTQQLVANMGMERRLARAGQKRILEGGHRYEDRLRQILDRIGWSVA
jgi:spore maturation protein CgeB